MDHPHPHQLHLSSSPSYELYMTTTVSQLSPPLLELDIIKKDEAKMAVPKSTQKRFIGIITSTTRTYASWLFMLLCH